MVDEHLSKHGLSACKEAAANTPAMTEAILHLRRQLRGGKMIRPALVLLSYHACRPSCDSHRKTHPAAHNKLIRAAAIVEMIHNATLLHDDVIDEGRQRRRLPTANSLWGNEFAILLGDFLLSTVFQMCTKLQPEAAGIIAQTTHRICRGELIQIIQRRNWKLSESQYIHIITEKSASLFADSSRLGAILAGAKEAQIRALASFGRDIGVAFQIVDDLLDIIGDETKTGKTLRSDANKNEVTLSIIHLLQAVGPNRRAATIKTLNAATHNKDEHTRMVEILNSHGSLRYARDRADTFVEKAIEALGTMEKNDAVAALVQTAEFVRHRVL